MPQDSQLVSAAEALRGGTSLSNLYINIGGQSTSSLTGDNVDQRLSTTDQLISISDELSRNVSRPSANNLFSNGEMVAFYATAEIVKTQSATYLQKMFAAGQNIDKITVYGADTINGTQTITEEIEYSNCVVTDIFTSGGAVAPGAPSSGLESFTFKFRYLQRQDTLYFFDQEGNPKGQDVSLINFPQGTLAPAGAAPAEGD